jgi:hypothetical protein
MEKEEKERKKARKYLVVKEYDEDKSKNQLFSMTSIITKTG